MREPPSPHVAAQRLWSTPCRKPSTINGFSASNPRISAGGVKKSGYGRELSHFRMREFTNAQAVWTKFVG